uniref:WPP domain-containing protein n=1 Tax=Oryza brachyantha TaxID=4533 RepID=J3MU51_ORYBR
MVVDLPANGAVGSPAAEVEAGASPGNSPVIKTKGRGLRRWRRIPREQRKEGARSSLHGKNPRAAWARADKTRPYAAAEAEKSRSSVESDLRSSNAVNSRQSGAGVAGNGIRKVLADDCDHSDVGQSSDELRWSPCKVNGSVIGRLAQGSVDSDADNARRSVGKNGYSGSSIQSSADPYAESILLLQRTQEALENEIQKFADISRESSDDSDGCHDDWSGTVHLEGSLKETSEDVKVIEPRLEEASYLGQLFLEKTEAEIQSIILTRAAQAWAPLAEDQIALYNAQKSLSGDYKQLELKLQHTKNRAMMLEDMAEKLKAECKDLSAISEVLRFQSRASRVSLFCFIQFILLITAIVTLLAPLIPSPTEDLVPT